MCWFKAWNSPWMLSLLPGGCEVELFNCLAVTLQCFMDIERISCHRVYRQILAELKLFRLCFILPHFIWKCSWPSCSFQWNTLRHCLFFCRKEERRARGWRRKEMSTSRKEVGWTSLSTLCMVENLTSVLSHHGAAAENPEGDLTLSLLNFITSSIFHQALEKRQRYQTSFRV